MEMNQNKKIILFDGVCNLCNNCVQYVIEHDKVDLLEVCGSWPAYSNGYPKKSGIGCTTSLLKTAINGTVKRRPV